VSNQKNNRQGFLSFIIGVFIVGIVYYVAIGATINEPSILGVIITIGVVVGVLLSLFILYVFGYNIIKNKQSFSSCVKWLPELLKWIFSSKNRNVNNQLAKDFKILSEACDPEKFILKVDEFLTTSTTTIHEFNCRWNVALAYYELGEIDRAIQMTEDLIPMYDNHKSLQRLVQKCFLYDQLVSFNLNAREYDKAKIYMDLRDEEMQRLSDTERQNFEEMLFPYSRGAQLFSEGRYEHALAYQKKVYAKNETLGHMTNLTKMGSHYQFAKIYEKLGDLEKEIKHLRLVVKHGNKFKKAADARQRLFELGEDVPVEEAYEVEEMVKEVLEVQPKQHSLLVYIVMVIIAIGIWVWVSS